MNWVEEDAEGSLSSLYEMHATSQNTQTQLCEIPFKSETNKCTLKWNRMNVMGLCCSGPLLECEMTVAWICHNMYAERERERWSETVR